MTEETTVVNNFDFVNVPESFFLSIVESNFTDFKRQNWITSNIILVGNIDENFIHSSSEKWYNAQFEFTSDLIVERLLQVIAIPCLTADIIIISQDDASNLMKTGCPSGEVPFVKRMCKLTLSQELEEKPKKATEVSICLLTNLLSIETDVIDIILLNYFQYPRYLYKNDIFGVDVIEYLPELKYTKGYNNANMIYFKVCDIKGPEYLNYPGNDISPGYIVDHTVSLYQTTTQNAFLPSQSYLVCSQNFCEEKISIKNFLKSLLPQYLQKYAEKLMNLFHPFMVCKLEELQLKPFFVISGPVGSGKTQLLSGVAKYLGLQYWRVECTSLIFGSSSSSETELSAVFTKLKKNVPCLLHLNNIEVLNVDLEGKENIGLVSHFSKFLTETKCYLPFIVVGTTDSIDQLSCELLQNVLHSINIDSPSVEERADVLTWISQISHTVAMKVAARTSGFTLSDLACLISQTSREKYKLTNSSAIENQSNELEYEDFIKIIERMNSQAVNAPQVPTVSWTDVGGHNEIKKEIVRSLNTSEFGTGLRRSGILLWGPPGTGKTLLAKAVANECKSTFLSVKGPELLNMYFGESEQNVREVFRRAREAAPCIIFFDEIDSLAPNRGRADSSGVMDRVVSQLLSEMDGLQKNNGVFLLGATNRPDLIDPALLRPGRLDKMLYVGPCEGTEAKLSVLKALTRKFKMANDVDLYQIADGLPRCLTGAELYSVCFNAWQNAARAVIKKMQNSDPESDDTVIVSADDFHAAMVGLSSAS